MTKQKSFKRLVRARMEKTGESYTAARAALLAAEEPRDAAARRSRSPTRRSGERTGRGWEEWFDLLDEWGAPERTHTEIARWVASGTRSTAGWDAQSVTVSYERARGLRAVGEQRRRVRDHRVEDGRACRSSALFDAFVDEPAARALAARRRAPRAHGDEAEVGPLRLGRRATPAWSSASTRRARRRARSRSSTSGSPTPRRPSGWKRFWRDAPQALKAQLEAGEIDA